MLRPLDERGRRQAEDLVRTLGDHRFDRVLSSPYLRCVQTVEPLAAARALDVEPDPRLGEGGDHAAIELVRRLLEAGADAVLCSHGDVIPAVLRAAARDGVALPAKPPCRFASTWVIEGGGGRFDNARHLGVG